MFWNFKKPSVEALNKVAAAFEVDGKSFLVAEQGLWVETRPATEIKSWQSLTPVKTSPAYLQYRFTTINPKPVKFTSGEYPIVKIRTSNVVHVLADVDVQFDNDNYWTLTTKRNAYIMDGPLFDFGFDYEEAERERIEREEEAKRQRETEDNLAQLIVNLLDDYADKDEEYHVKTSWSLGNVEVRGAFDFIGIGKILNSSNEEIDDLDFIYALAKSFRESQQEEYVQLVDSEFLHSVEVYGGTYDLIQVAKDVIAYIDDKKKEGNDD